MNSLLVLTHRPLGRRIDLADHRRADEARTRTGNALVGRDLAGRDRPDPDGDRQNVAGPSTADRVQGVGSLAMYLGVVTLIGWVLTEVLPKAETTTT